MNSAPNNTPKHKRRHTMTPTVAPTTVHHHHTMTPTAAPTVSPTVVHHHHTMTPTVAPTVHFTRPAINFTEILIPANERIGEDPYPPFPLNETMSFATVVPESVRSGYNFTPFVFALPFIVLGAWIAQTKLRRHGYAPIRTVEISSSSEV